jgi:DNA-binding transcriptional LysR family regulator
MWSAKWQCPTDNYPFRLIAGLDHPLAKHKRLSLADIAPFPLILPPSHLTTWRVVNYAFGQHNVTFKVKMEAGGWEVIKKLRLTEERVRTIYDTCRN